MKIGDVSTDRYQAAGVPYPDPETVCRGQCEGMGVYPKRRLAIVRCFRLIVWWLAGGEEELRPDGYRFVTCESCAGTGRRMFDPSELSHWFMDVECPMCGIKFRLLAPTALGTDAVIEKRCPRCGELVRFRIELRR